ncbi:SDR family NAD(P)-dependent oxidoreductase [Catenuloplanes japonicus]|uniref:SDR family NAD(P)-dependent oxidoreductase n=1 Tax=Catenuloplanes japonicus TaxID=33876 RepID=UPI000526F75D|nr:SDR family oxidoreductase [Catenuloplanes japonicus]
MSTHTWAVVTGSSSGIGRAAALKLAEDGHAIVVCGRDQDRVTQTVRQIEDSGGRAAGFTADLSSPAAVLGLAGQVRAAVGEEPIEVLVNNAGGGGFSPTEDTTAEMFDAVFNLNVKAPYLLTGAFAPAMAARGHGVIVNVGSLSSTMAASGTSAFQAAKAALNMLTRSWTAEYGPRGVRINSVDPGYILTRVNAHMRDMFGGYLQSVPAGRGGAPEEVAEAIRFLASPRASYIHGTVLTVDGGKTSVVAM